MRFGPAAVLLFVLAAPLAAAHTAVTVHAPTAPLAPFKTTGITVDLAAECADTFLLDGPAVSADRDLALSEDAPKGLAWTGETVTLSALDCDPADAPGSGTLLVTPDGSIPAFTDIALEVVCEACEGGTFTAQVGYAANLTAKVPSGLKTGTPFAVVLNLSTNHDTNLTITVAKAGAHATLASFPALVSVDSPLVENKTSRLVTLNLEASGPAAGWSTDQVVLSIQPVAKGKGVNGTALNVTLPIANGAPPSVSQSASTSRTSSSATGSGSRSGSTTTTSASSSSGGSKDSPAPSGVLAVAVAAVAVALVRRRR